MRRVRGELRSGSATSRRIAAIAILLGVAAIALPSDAQQVPPPAAPPLEAPVAAPTVATPPAPKPEAPKRPTVSKPAAEPPAPPPPPSEQAWVRGEVRVNFRANPSPTSVPVGVTKTGDQVGVYERRGDWTRIQLGDASGWLPSSNLDATPPPREHVVQLEAQVADLQAKLDAATRAESEQSARVAQLASADAERSEAMRRLTDENRDLRAGERWPYLVTGAGILGIGLAVGLLLRGGTRRSSSRIRF